MPVTTIRNNFNRHRIFGFRAKLQTPQFVLMPSCATIKPNRGLFSREGNPKPLKFSRFKTCNSFSFNKAPRNTAPFSAVLRASEPAAPVATGCNRMGGNEVLSKGALLPLPRLRSGFEWRGVSYESHGIGKRDMKIERYL